MSGMDGYYITRLRQLGCKINSSEGFEIEPSSHRFLLPKHEFLAETGGCQCEITSVRKYSFSFSLIQLYMVN